MTRPEHPGFRSWEQGLAEGKLEPGQRAILEAMVERGEADSVAGAARMLDWQESNIDRTDSMYGAR